MTNVTIIADTDTAEGYGIYNQAGGGSLRVEVNNAQIRSSLNTIVNDGEFTTHVGASQLVGGTTTGAGTVICAGVYDEDYAFCPDTCP